ncbi:MAG: hypothetical protein M1819_004627 [Sarea resinae]|nr:MAG: hypothetical protein M1819_004627 [Sarea resinae]
MSGHGHVKQYLPQVDLQVHASILSTTSRTLLTQTFINPSETDVIKEAVYTFPLYDGVSVVGFNCRIGVRRIKGVVKEKQEAQAVYDQTISRGETAGLLEEDKQSSDVFTTKLGNIPAGKKVIVEITYLGELKHDAEAGGIRYTIPTAIAPRYGQHGPFPTQPSNARAVSASTASSIQITVDAEIEEGSFIKGIQSPSHPISVTIGNTSVALKDPPSFSRASATLSLGEATLDADFVLLVLAEERGRPKALLETHSSIPNQRALMVTLIPKFSLPQSRPEIVFIADRSGSMGGKIQTLVSAMKVFLKSLPVGVKFNICSFGSRSSFLWDKSQGYNQHTLYEAVQHVESFSANYGGTDMVRPIKETIERRYKDLALEMMLLTDGEIRGQWTLFSMINQQVGDATKPIRLFTLGIGDAISHSLLEGAARAGNGFSQVVGEKEKLDSKVVRMLKGGLSPHVMNYSLQLKYDPSDGEGEGVLERINESSPVDLEGTPTSKIIRPGATVSTPISLFDDNADPDRETSNSSALPKNKYADLPSLTPPRVLQAPAVIPPLFPFTRTTVYLLLSSETLQTPKSVILSGISPHGPLELEIDVQVLEQPCQTIHQLAAKKAILDLEEGRGWMIGLKDTSGKLIKGNNDKVESKWDDLVEREAVRLGVKYQVGGKWCSFVAVERESKNSRNSGRHVSIYGAGSETLEKSDQKDREDNSDENTTFDDDDSNSTSESWEEISTSDIGMPRVGETSRWGRGGIRKQLASKAARRSVSFGNLQRTGAPPVPSGREGADFSTVSGNAASPMAQGQGTPWMGGAPTPTIQGRGGLFGASRSQDISDLPQAQGTNLGTFGTTAVATAPQLYAKAEGTQMPLYQPQPQLSTFPAQMSPSPGAAVQSASASLPDEGNNAAHSSAKKKKKMSVFDGATPFSLSSSSSSTPTPFEILVSLQTFSGSWDLAPALLDTLQLSADTVAQSVSRVLSSPSQVITLDTNHETTKSVFATLLAIVFLELRVADEKEAWELMVEKARTWLDDTVSDGNSGKGWLQGLEKEARDLVKEA